MLGKVRRRLGADWEMVVSMVQLLLVVVASMLGVSMAHLGKSPFGCKRVDIVTDSREHQAFALK